MKYCDHIVSNSLQPLVTRGCPASREAVEQFLIALRATSAALAVPRSCPASHLSHRISQGTPPKGASNKYFNALRSLRSLQMTAIWPWTASSSINQNLRVSNIASSSMWEVEQCSPWLFRIWPLYTTPLGQIERSRFQKLILLPMPLAYRLVCSILGYWRVAVTWS